MCKCLIHKLSLCRYCIAYSLFLVNTQDMRLVPSVKGKKCGRAMEGRGMIGFNLLEFLVDLSTKPIKTLTKAITSSRTCTLALPRPVRDRVETKTAAQVLWLDCVWKVLFVGIDKKNRITKLIFFKELVQFIASFVDPVDVIRVDDEDQTLCVVVVVSPHSSRRRRSNLVCCGSSVATAPEYDPDRQHPRC